MKIVGETENDRVIDTRLGSKHISINLGRATVISQLGSELIIGEPGKVSNGIYTDPIYKMIICNRHGKKLSKKYFDPESPTPSICRISSGDTTVFPQEELTLVVPNHLQHSTVTVTPRGNLADIFPAQCKFITDKIKLLNMSDLPVNLKKHAHIADVRQTTLITPNEMKHVQCEVNAVHQHDSDNFKYSPTVKTIVKPNIEAVSIDPDNIMPDEVKLRFWDITKRFENLFLTTPGRYNGYYGAVDNSLRFTSPSIQSSRVAMPNYSADMQQKLAAKMDELREKGVLITLV